MAGVQEGVQVGDGLTKHLGLTLFLFTDLQHPVGHRSPHVRLHLRLHLTQLVLVPHLSPQQCLEDFVTEEDGWVAVASQLSTTHHWARWP